MVITHAHAQPADLDVRGSKMTGLGELPRDWQVLRLSELCTQICDGTHFTPRYVNNGVPFYSVENVTSRDFENTKYISHTEHRELIKRCNPARGDILMTRITAGIIGDTYLIDWDVNASIYVSLALLKPSRRVSSNYLYAYTRSPAFVASTERRALTNATPKKINMADIGKIEIPIPPSIQEQETIAEALSDAEALIESLEALVSKKRAIKQGAMQDLLSGRKRLPGFSGEWITKTLGDLAYIKTGSRNNQDKTEDGDYPFFVRSETIERLSTYGYDCEAILVPGEGGIGSIFHYIVGKFDAHQRVYIVSQFSPEVHGKYVHLYMVQNFGAHAMQNTVKATVDSLRLPTFQKFEVRLPPSTKEQEEIADVLTCMESELDTLEEGLVKARQLKQGMMQELLTGRIRLV